MRWIINGGLNAPTTKTNDDDDNNNTSQNNHTFYIKLIRFIFVRFISAFCHYFTEWALNSGGLCAYKLIACHAIHHASICLFFHHYFQFENYFTFPL